MIEVISFSNELCPRTRSDNTYYVKSICENHWGFLGSTNLVDGFVFDTVYGVLKITQLLYGV